MKEDLGAYLREQRQHAKLSLRQLSDAADVSNPYLSQIERGLKKPSAEILQSLAKGLRISAESLYVRAGILDERDEQQVGIEAAILSDPVLNERQKSVLLDIYESFRAENARAATTAESSTERPAVRTQAAKQAAAAKKSTTKTATSKAATSKAATSKAATPKAEMPKRATAKTTRKSTTTRSSS